MTKIQQTIVKAKTEDMRKLAESSEADPERAHSEADNLLCETLQALGCVEIVEQYHKVHKWYA